MACLLGSSTWLLHLARVSVLSFFVQPSSPFSCSRSIGRQQPSCHRWQRTFGAESNSVAGMTRPAFLQGTSSPARWPTMGLPRMP